MASKPHNKRLWVEVSGDINLKFSSGAKFGERSNKVDFQIGFRVDRHEKYQKFPQSLSPAYKTGQSVKKWIPKNCCGDLTKLKTKE